MNVSPDQIRKFLDNLPQYSKDIRWEMDWYATEALILRGPTTLDRLKEVASIFDDELNEHKSEIRIQLSPGVVLRIYRSASTMHPYILGFIFTDGGDSFVRENAHLFAFLQDLPEQRLKLAQRELENAMTRVNILTTLVDR